jgi:hypothetical protein
MRNEGSGPRNQGLNCRSPFSENKHRQCGTVCRTAEIDLKKERSQTILGLGPHDYTIKTRQRFPCLMPDAFLKIANGERRTANGEFHSFLISHSSFLIPHSSSLLPPNS